MRKILVCDHKFNVDSISSSSNTIKFFGLNDKLSFYDNFDIINPDCVWINKGFIDLDNYDIKNIPVKIIEYNIPYIIPNSFANITKTNDKIISCILLNNNEPIQDRIYKYDNLYVRFYSNIKPLNHLQYCGQIYNCKDVTDIIVSSEKIIIDSDILQNMCLFYNKPYAMFKSKGTLSWINQAKINIITNTELLLTNEQ